MPPSLQDKIAYIEAKLGNPEYGDEETKLGDLARYKKELASQTQINNKITNKRSNDSTRWRDLSAPRLLEQVQNLVNQKKISNASLPQPIYQGQQVSPMSALTQKGRELQSGWNQKGAPFQNKMNTVLARNPEGLNQGQRNSLADMIEKGQGNFSENKSFKALQDQFGNPINAIKPEFMKASGERGARQAGIVNERLGTLGQKIGNAESESNQTLVNLFKALQSGKQQKRQSYVDTANELGGQQHAYNNMNIEADKQKFYNEANHPHKQLATLEKILRTSGMVPEDANSAEILQTLQNYGIDTNKFISETQQEKPYQGFEGQRVANQTPEQIASYNSLERVNPKTTRSATYPQEKQSIRELMDPNTTIGNQVVAQVPASIQRQVEELERKGNELMRRRIGGLSNKYANLGQHGSMSHTSEARSIAEEVEEAIAAEKAKMIEAATAEQAGIAQSGMYNKIKHAAQLGNAGHNEFMNTLGNIQNTARLGNEKFNNNQDENDRIYNNYQTQNEWLPAHNKIRMDALNDVVRGQGSTMYDKLNRNNTAYSEHEKAMRNAQAEYKTLNETLAAFPGQIQAEEAILQQQIAQQQQKADQDKQYNEDRANRLKISTDWEELNRQNKIRLNAERDARHQTTKFNPYPKYNDEYRNNLIDFGNDNDFMKKSAAYQKYGITNNTRNNLDIQDVSRDNHYSVRGPGNNWYWVY